MWINHHSLPAGRQAYSNHNIAIDENIFQSILLELTSSQPVCADACPTDTRRAIRQGGKGDVSQNITYIYTIRRPF